VKDWVMERPVTLHYEQFAALRDPRPVPDAFHELWVCGSVEALRGPAVAIVGTRAATAYGKALAREFAAALVRAGCCIISGLALGIDAAAHTGALEAGGVTIGVLGGGHEEFFPPRNRPLAERMVACGGAVLSPYPPQHPAYPSQFLQRNGVVAALCDAVVVIEAPARSGALNTAGWAAGRIPVFAVPGDVDRPHVAGCHALIRDGAILARGAQDVIDDLRLAAPEQRAAPQSSTRAVPEDALQAHVLRLLRGGEMMLEEILAAAEEPPHRTLAALSQLEVRGAIEPRPGQRYARR
jgi:DNA processing protein